MSPERKVLGVPVRELAAGLLSGRAAQLSVDAIQSKGRWLVAATDTRTNDTIAFGSGITIELAEMHAQDDFIRRMNRAARRAA